MEDQGNLGLGRTKDRAFLIAAKAELGIAMTNAVYPPRHRVGELLAEQGKQSLRCALGWKR